MRICLGFLGLISLGLLGLVSVGIFIGFWAQFVSTLWGLFWCVFALISILDWSQHIEARVHRYQAASIGICLDFGPGSS